MPSSHRVESKSASRSASVVDLELLGAPDGDAVSFAPGARSSTVTTVLAEPSALKKVHVEGRVVGESKGPKITGFTYKPKSRSRRRFGHRQHYTTSRDHGDRIGKRGVAGACARRKGLGASDVQDQRRRLHPQRPRLTRPAPRREGVRRHERARRGDHRPPARHPLPPRAPTSSAAATTRCSRPATATVRFVERRGRQLVDVVTEGD